MRVGGFNDLEVVSCTFNDLLNANKKSIGITGIKGQLRIPEYQRPYVWGFKQLKKLIDDLNEFNIKGKGNCFYFGSFILHQVGNKLNIIDGQQRITSLMLLQLFQNTKVKSRIIYESPLSISRIKSNIDDINQKLHDTEISLPHLDLNKINVTLVVTKREDLAYTFFETQNTGGKRLSGADIIKSHHLRAINSNHIMGLQAKRWESKKMTSIEYVINILAKARFWNVLQWKAFPFYRNELQIKETIVNEFTEISRKDDLDITYRTIEITKQNNEEQSKFRSIYKAIRQPVYDGNNYFDFLIEYVDLYEMLFVEQTSHVVDHRFYEFRNQLLNGKNGTLFLKELFEITLITYVSKFGFNDIYLFSLWCFRYIYSVRVINRRTVREESIFKFVQDEKLIDIILNSFDKQQVISYLKNYSYSINTENCDKNNVKGRYILMLGNYFEKDFSIDEPVIERFDASLKKAIIGSL